MTRPLIGVLPGEGIGPEVIDCALQVLAAVESVSDIRASIETGGEIGLTSRDTCGHVLSPEVIDFCTDIFARGGAILAAQTDQRLIRQDLHPFHQGTDLGVMHCPIAEMFQVHPAMDQGHRGTVRQ